MGKGVGIVGSINKLTAKKVQQASEPGHLNDGGGLYLQISRTGTKSWVFKFKRNGRAREMGLGSFRNVSLADAREKAVLARKVVADGGDPIEERRDLAAQNEARAAGSQSFADCGRAYIEAKHAGWKNAKHAKQWRSTLEQHAFPVIGNIAVDAIDTEDVLRVLKPIWCEIAETASRLRGRIESILDYAKVLGRRNGENPARWRGHLDHVLPPRGKVRPVVHHPALEYDALPKFMQSLREQPGIAARALEFSILTASRSGEVRGAQWSEINLQTRVWTVPAARMKAGKEHRVPLSERAVEVLTSIPRVDGKDTVFISPRGGELSDMSLTAVLRRMDLGGITQHGFRSTFRDWAGETTSFPREVIEHALAHKLKDKAEAAYQRGDLFVKRAKLMDAWARYSVEAKSADIVPIQRAAEG